MEKNKLNGRPRIQHEPEGLTLTQLKAHAIRKWYLFVIFLLLLGGVAFFINRTFQPRYAITTTVLVKNDAKILELFDVFQQNQRPGKPSALIADQIGVLTSYSLNLNAMKALDWKHSWFKKNLFSYTDLYKNDPFELKAGESTQLDMVPVTIEVLSDRKFEVSAKENDRIINGREIDIDFTGIGTFGEPFKNPFFNFTIDKKANITYEPGDKYVLVFNNLAKLAHYYKDRLEVTQADENSNLIVVKLETTQLQRDVDYLNQLANHYIQKGLDEKNRIANNTVHFIDDLIDGVNDSLQIAGNTFTTFRSRNKTVNLGAEATSMVNKLQTLDQEESRLNLKLEYYRNLRYYLQNRDEIRDLVAPSLVGVQDEDMNSMVMKLNDLYTRREVLSYTVQDKNPTLIALNNEIDFTQKLIGEKVENQISNTEIEIRSLQEEQRKAGSQLARLPKTEQDLIGIKRNYDLNNELYTFLLERRAEADIARASNSPDAQVLDPSSADIAELLGPKKVRNYITAVLASIVLFVVTIFLSEYFSNKIKTTDEITNALDFPVIASITENKFNSEVPVIQYPKAAITESFRGLRINLQNHFRNQQVLAVHSYISGEGKSFIALNLALVTAISNKRVLLIDADLRKPRLHTILRPKHNRGLGDYLMGKAKLDEIIQPTQHPGFYFVSAGTLPANPAELLNSDVIATFNEVVKERFDFIVYDNAPFGVVSDATLIGLHADVNLFLVRLNYSMKENLDEINKVYHEGVLRNVLVAINGQKQRSGYGYYEEHKRQPVTV